MRIVHVSRSDLDGGAALAAYRLHTALRAAGEDSTMLVETKDSNDETVIEVSLSQRPSVRMRRNLMSRHLRRDHQRYLAGRSPSAMLFSDDRAAYGADVARHIPSDAVVTLHWIARFAGLDDLLPALAEEQRLVWRLADMNPFTGGCHYDAGCGRFSDSCGMCPLLLASSADDLSHRAWRRKRAALAPLSDEQMHVVALSRQWAELSRASSLLGRFPVTVVPPMVDTDVFRPVDTERARRELGLDPAALILVFVAHDLSSAIKGADLLGEALRSLSADVGGLTLLTVGHQTMTEIGPRNTLARLGSVDASRLAIAYSCADLAVLPSRQEAFGQVVIEALACGVPVAGFATGGIRDAITDGETGFVASEVTAASLCSTLLRALGDRQALGAMRHACRQVAERRFSAAVVAREYQFLYRSLRDGTAISSSHGASGSGPSDPA